MDNSEEQLDKDFQFQTGYKSLLEQDIGRTRNFNEAEGSAKFRFSLTSNKKLSLNIPIFYYSMKHILCFIQISAAFFFKIILSNYNNFFYINK